MNFLWAFGSTKFHIVGEMETGDLAWACDSTKKVDPDETWDGWGAFPPAVCQRCIRIARLEKV